MAKRRGSFRTAVRQSPGVARLAAVRWSSQFGDGFFQAALSGAILFNPERETEPKAIALGFVVLLLPYSLVGPFAGAMLDRWDRRKVLVWATVARGAVTLAATAVLFASAAWGPADYSVLLVLALAAVGISRFMLAGVSAALPNLVAPGRLVATNSVLATVGAGLAGVGAAVSIVLITLLGESDFASGVAVAASAGGFVVAGIASAGFPAHALGPHLRHPFDPSTHRHHPTAAARAADAQAVAAGLVVGARAVWRAPGVTSALAALGAHRVAFGLNTLLMVLLLRQHDSVRVPGGLAGFGVAIACASAGMLLAAVLTPFVVPRLGRTRTIVAAAAAATVAQLALATQLTSAAMLAAAFCLGVAGQTIKLVGDAAMQIEISDDERGRVFALQDTVFNIAFVAAIGAASLHAPADGKSLPIALAGAAAYALGLAAIALNSRRRAPRPAGL